VFLPRRQRPAPLPPRLSVEEARAHTSFVEKLGINALWRRFVA
jgi:DNA polymerase-3 subunit epsilon